MASTNIQTKHKPRALFKYSKHFRQHSPPLHRLRAPLARHSMASTNKRTNEAGQAGGDQKQKRFKSKYTSTITVIVADDDDNIFTPHKNLICTNSDFFKAACSEEWRKYQSRVVRLPAPTRPEHFQHYLDWLYSRQTVKVSWVILADLESNGGLLPGESQELKVVDELVDLWILGDFLLDGVFKDCVIDELLASESVKRGLVWTETIRKIVDRTVSGSGIHRWMLKHVAALATAEEMRKIRRFFPAETVLELLEAVTSLRKLDTKGHVPMYGQRNTYHDKFAR